MKEEPLSFPECGMRGTWPWGYNDDQEEYSLFFQET